MTYDLDPSTFLPQRIAADVPFRGGVHHCERLVGDYRESGGVQLPHAFTSTNWGEPGPATVESVEVNPCLGRDRFALPARLR